MNTRTRKPKAPACEAAAPLIDALRFIAPTQKKNGTLQQQFCVIMNHWLIATNGILSAAVPVPDDLYACPHSTLLLEALQKCKGELVITQLSAEMISVISGEFKAMVPCADINQLYDEQSIPDPVCAVIDERVKQALAAVVGLVDESSEKPHFASVLLQSCTAVGTNGAGLLEYWHGIDLPPNLLLPKAFVSAVVKCKKALTGFGFSANSVTFHFEDGSFYKTQRFNASYPQYAHLFPPETDAKPVPEDFFKAVRAIEKFSKDGIVYFNEGVVSSHMVENEASTYRLEDLSEGMAFNASYLLKMEHAFKTAEFDKATNRVICFADNLRGVLMGVELNLKPAAYGEDDIPF